MYVEAMAENKAIPVIISGLNIKLDGEDPTALHHCKAIVKRYYGKRQLDYARYFQDITTAAKYAVAESCYQFVTGHSSTMRWYRTMLKKTSDAELIGPWGYPIDSGSNAFADPSLATPKRKMERRDETSSGQARLPGGERIVTF